MANLYILSEQFRILNEMIEDAMADEDFDKDDIQSYIETVDSIKCSLEVKVENIHKLYRNIDSDIDGLRAEEVRLAKKRKYLENKAEMLKDYVLKAMTNAKIDKIEGAFGARRQKSNPSLEIVDESIIPEEYKKTEVSVKKQDLLTAIKKLPEGETIAGARIAKTTYHLKWK